MLPLKVSLGRFSTRDIEKLNHASELLAATANAIRQTNLSANFTQPASNFLLEIPRWYGDREFALKPIRAGFCHLHGTEPMMTNSLLPWVAAMVRAGGLEPPRFASLEPKSSASANSATPAFAARAAIAARGGVPTTAAPCNITAVGRARESWLDCVRVTGTGGLFQPARNKLRIGLEAATRPSPR